MRRRKNYFSAPMQPTRIVRQFKSAESRSRLSHSPFIKPERQADHPEQQHGFYRHSPRPRPAGSRDKPDRLPAIRAGHFLAQLIHRNSPPLLAHRTSRIDFFVHFSAFTFLLKPFRHPLQKLRRTSGRSPHRQSWRRSRNLALDMPGTQHKALARCSTRSRIGKNPCSSAAEEGRGQPQAVCAFLSMPLLDRTLHLLPTRSQAP